MTNPITPPDPETVASAAWRQGYGEGCRDMLERNGTHVTVEDPEQGKDLFGFIFAAILIFAGCALLWHAVSKPFPLDKGGE